MCNRDFDLRPTLHLLSAILRTGNNRKLTGRSLYSVGGQYVANKDNGASEVKIQFLLIFKALQCNVQTNFYSSKYGDPIDTLFYWHSIDAYNTINDVIPN